jgi:hypothetical protein
MNKPKTELRIKSATSVSAVDGTSPPTGNCCRQCDRSSGSVGNIPAGTRVELVASLDRRIPGNRDLRVEEREPEAAGAGQVEVALEAGGICGSNLRCFNHGGFGTVRGRSAVPAQLLRLLCELRQFLPVEGDAVAGPRGRQRHALVKH